MSFLRAINLFPWDVASEGAAECLGAITDLGCNSVILSPNYHRARLFRPRTLGFYNRPIDWCDFRPDPSLYEEPGLLPPINPDARCVEGCHQAAIVAKANGLDVIVSVIGCHNTTIGLSNPELCVENALGDRYAFALSPAQPRVRSFLGSLVRDLCRQYRPSSLLLDSFSYLDAVHREHHELMFVSPGAFGKYLLSLCFCPASCDRLRHEGIDPVALRAQVIKLVQHAVANTPGPRSPEAERDELTGMLFEFPEFLAAARIRSDIVAELLNHIAAIAREEGVRLYSQSALLARPTSRVWTEGAGLRTRAESCEKIFIQAHWPSAREAIHDLSWAATVLPAERFVLGTMTSEDNVATEADLVQRAVAAKRIGAAGVSFYNYGLLSAARLGWIRAANTSTR
jgi:hypothetical protein